MADGAGDKAVGLPDCDELGDADEGGNKLEEAADEIVDVTANGLGVAD